MKRNLLILLLFLSGNILTSQENDKKEIINVIDKQVTDWNSGSVEKFMEGYLKSENIRFASGGKVYYGWDAMLERYNKSYSTKEKMGKLIFSGLDIKLFSNSAAIVFGEWKVERAADTLGGLFTLIFEKNKSGWKIVHDHTSSKEK